VNRRDERPEPVSDERLLADFLAGDREAFRRLVDRYGPDLSRFVGRFVRASATIDDVVQETFIQVFQSAEGFDLSRRFRPWLFTIAANKARDHLRSVARKREVPVAGFSGESDESINYLDYLADTHDDPGKGLEAEELRQRVGEIVGQMPDHLREVLVLGYYHRFPYKEIADILSIPLGTVKSRLHAAVSYFARAYEKVDRQR
jgi:RNA polymerase sigma-70 factor (ECF subfamily)